MPHPRLLHPSVNHNQALRLCAGFQLHAGARTRAFQALSFLTLQEGVGREDRDGVVPGTKAGASLPPQPFPSLRSQYACISGFQGAEKNVQVVILINFLQLDPKHLWMERNACEITRFSFWGIPQLPMYLGICVFVYMYVKSVG